MTEPDDITRAAARLAEGGLVAFPTETVYGLGADATNRSAIGRVFSLKGRPSANPLIVHVTGEEMARTCVSSWPEAAAKAAAAFWPGPLTLVLPKSDLIPSIATAGGETVAVRMPDHDAAVALIEALGRPIVGPSANPSGYVSPTMAEHVRAHFDADAVLVVDGGACRAGIESTVLDLTGSLPRVLRRGVIGTEELVPVLGPVEIADGSPEEDGPVASPGVLGAHYRPEAPVTMLDDVSLLSRTVGGADGPVALLGPPGRRIRVGPPHLGIDMPGFASRYARKLYAALREADAAKPVRIIVVNPLLKDSEIWDAVRERLRRASGDA
jgi:L-threonylcarbamoyladenylate synthase